MTMFNKIKVMVNWGGVIVLLLSVMMAFSFASCSNDAGDSDDDYDIILSDLTFCYATDSEGNKLLTSGMSADDAVQNLPKADPMKIPSAKHPKVYCFFKLTWKGTYYPADHSVETYTFAGQTFTNEGSFNYDDARPSLGSGHYWGTSFPLNSSSNAGKTMNVSMYVVDKNGGRSNTLSFTLHWE